MNTVGPAETHELDAVVVIVSCRCGWSQFRSTEDAAMYALDQHCERPAETSAP